MRNRNFKSKYNLCVFLAVVLILSCHSKRQFIDYRTPETLEERKAVRAAPIVLLGAIERDNEAGPEIASHWDKKVPLQLHRIRVAVEAYLRGDLRLSKVDLYYYKFAGAYNGPPPLGYWTVSGLYPEGFRRIFFVRHDGDLLRLACDGYNTCTIRVGSGAHPHLDSTVSDEQPLEAKIADVLFTKGLGVTDRKFAESLAYSLGHVDEQYSALKLKQLVESTNPDIRQAACAGFRFDLNPQYIESDRRIKAICQKYDTKQSAPQK